MAKISGWQQLKGLLYRNFLIKKRNPKRTLQEVIIPAYFIVLLILMQLTMKVKHYDQVPEYPEVSNIPELVPQKFSIAVIPDTVEVVSFMNSLYSNDTYIFYTDESAFLKSYVSDVNRSIQAAVVFKREDLMHYKIRFPYNNSAPLPLTYFIPKERCLQPFCPTEYYIYSPFASFQEKINHGLIKKLTNDSNLKPASISFRRMPKPAFDSDNSPLRILSSLYLVLALSPIVTFIMISLVNEKQKKIKETMKIMGLKQSIFWLSWVIVYIITVIIVTILIVALVKFGNLFAKGNFILLFLGLFLYGSSVVTLACAVTPLFSNSLTAGTVGSFSASIFSLFYLAVGLNKSTSPYVYGALSLLSPTAFAIAIDTAFSFEVSDGIQFSNINKGLFPFSYSLCMLILDTIIYALIGFYLDNVIPGEYGRAHSFWFCLQPSYWCKGVRNKRLSSGKIDIIKDGENGQTPFNQPDFEEVSPEIQSKVAFRILNIRKEFSKKKYEATDVAVNDFSLDIYEGQITALLGHNGAGKTTLINMLTGLISPTSGTALIYDHDINDVNALDEIRAMSGVCPQHDILFDEITPEEHLKIFAYIKGVNSSRINEEINSILQDIDLNNKRTVQVNKLSGGEKRRLSVGIALIGNPKILFLDEPTSGVDPVSRRKMWTLLQKRKEGKTILLTTHFMDEADILADRKAIISKGKLRCVGSSLFLKNRFGIGYHLTMVLLKQDNKDEITRFVQEHLPSAEFERTHGVELSYILPLKDVENFVLLFKALDEAKDQLGIQSYGVSMTTLEEVFIKLGEETDEDGDFSNGIKDNFTHKLNYSENNVNQLNDDMDINMQNEVIDEIEHNFFEKFLALAWIRILLTIRNPMAVIFRIVMPAIFVIIGVVIGKLADSSVVENPQIEILPELYLNKPNTSLSLKSSFAYQNVSGPDLRYFLEILQQNVSTIAVRNYNSLNKTETYVGAYIKTFDSTVKKTYDSTVWFNDTAVHSIPVALNLLSNVFLSALYKSKNMVQVPSINLIIQPLPKRENDGLIFDVSVFNIVFLVGFAFAMIPTGFGVEAVMDREVKARNSLRVAGASFLLYWSSMAAVHMLTYLTVFVLCLILIPSLNLVYFTYAGAMIAFILLFLLYMPTSLFFSYCLSFLFSKRESAQNILPFLMIMLGIIPYIPIFILDLNPENDSLVKTLHIVFTIIDPCYSLFGGLYFITKVYRMKAFLGFFTISDYFSWSSNIPVTLLLLALQGVFLFAVLYILDSFSFGINILFKHKAYSYINSDIIPNEDEDVTEERRKVKESDFGTRSPVLLINSIRKTFSNQGFCKKKKKSETKVAVRNLSLAIGNGEIFGLLGPNGAGKTTTLSILSAEQKPDIGKVILNGYDIILQTNEIFQFLGYCPQHDQLWENITLSEHIACYASVTGVPRRNVKAVSHYYVQMLKVEDHTLKKSKNLSGGTKRKLSFILSILGSPRITLLDEPSTGMDPQSKRNFWNAIMKSFSENKSAILTTHSMEEADAICSRVGIMIRGALRCLGSTQHLKDRHGRGYQLEIKLQHQTNLTNEKRFHQLQQFVQQHFPSAQIEEHFENRVFFSIPHAAVTSLGDVFLLLAQAKENVGIEEYSFSQTTLEQVFLGFAKEQELEADT